MTTLSSKGQITVPAAIMRELGLRPGERLMVVPIHDGLVVRRIVSPLSEALAGSIPSGTYGDAEQYVRNERDSWPI